MALYRIIFYDKSVNEKFNIGLIFQDLMVISSPKAYPTSEIYTHAITRNQFKQLESHIPQITNIERFFQYFELTTECLVQTAKFPEVQSDLTCEQLFILLMYFIHLDQNAGILRYINDYLTSHELLDILDIPFKFPHKTIEMHILTYRDLVLGDYQCEVWRRLFIQELYFALYKIKCDQSFVNVDPKMITSSRFLKEKIEYGETIITALNASAPIKTNHLITEDTIRLHFTISNNMVFSVRKSLYTVCKKYNKLYHKDVKNSFYILLAFLYELHINHISAQLDF